MSNRQFPVGNGFQVKFGWLRLTNAAAKGPKGLGNNTIQGGSCRTKLVVVRTSRPSLADPLGRDVIGCWLTAPVRYSPETGERATSMTSIRWMGERGPSNLREGSLRVFFVTYL